MSLEVGLARVSCPRMGRSFLTPVQSLLASKELACPIVSPECPPCLRSFLVKEIEDREPDLARILAVHREQSLLSARHVRVRSRRSSG